MPSPDESSRRLGDLAALGENKESIYIYTLLKYPEFMKSIKFIIFPHNSLKYLFDNIIVALTFYVIMILPFKFAFIEENYFWWDGVDYFVDF
jgi:hypothetical protein